MAAGDPAAEEYLKEITAQAKAEGKLQDMSEAAEYLMQSAETTLDRVEDEVREYTMHERMGALTEAINLAYIARHYFGKTRQWLYQRIKGQTVNGRAATFTPKEEATFMSALSDIGVQISTITAQRV